MSVAKRETIGKLLPESGKLEPGGVCNRMCKVCKHIVGPKPGSVSPKILERDCQGVDEEGVSDPRLKCVLAEVLLRYGAT